MPIVPASEWPSTAVLRQHLSRCLPEIVFAQNDDRDGPTAAHSHPDLVQLSVFRRGGGCICINRRDESIFSDRLYLIPAGHRHSIAPLRRQRGTTIRFRLPGFHGTLPGPVLALAGHGEAIASLLDEAAVLHGRDDPARAALRLAEALLLALRHGHETGGTARPDSLAGRAATLIEARFREDLTVATLAGELGVGSCHLCRIFRREMQLTPMSFLRQLRTAFAAERLFRTREPLEVIAVQAGFGTVKNMRRAFHEQHGMTPQRFRERHQEY